MTGARLAASAAVALALAAGPVRAASPAAQEAPRVPQAEPAQGGVAVSAGADLVTASAFVWRGLVLCDSPVAQPNIWVKVGNLTASSWVNVARHGPNGQSLTEHDLTIDYSAPVGDWVLSAGWINYAFVNLADGRFTNELYAGISYSGLLSPAVTVYQDVHAGAGTYVSAGVSHSIAVGSRGWSIDPLATVGYNHRQWTPYSGFSDAVLEVDLSVPLGRISLQPFVAYSWSLDRRIAVNRFSWGIAASYDGR